MDRELKAAELLNQRPKPGVQLDTILLPLNGRNGFVFALCAIPGKGSEGLAVCRRLREELERLAASVDEQANAQHRFERFLASLNEQLSLAVKSGEWSFPIEQFNGVIGLATDQEMFLSGTGEMTALFLHRTPDHRYQVFNLSRNIQTEQALPTWEKVFAVVLDGDLHPGDVLCLSNEDLLRAIDGQELHDILTSIPPKSATAKIRQYLPPQTDIALLVLQARDPKSARNPAEQAQPLANLSVEDFEQTSSETSEILEEKNPGVLRFLSKLIGRRKRAQPRQRTSGGRRTWGKLRALIFLAAKGMRAVSRALRPRLRAASRFLARLTRRTDRVHALREARAKLAEAASDRRSRYKRMPKKTKRLMFAAAGVFAVFIVSIVVIAGGRAEQEVVDRYDARFAEVTDLRDQAEAAAIYRDEERARELYARTIDAARELPADTPERQAQVERLISRSQRALDELWKITGIPEPPVTARFADIGEARRIVSYDGALYALGTQGAAEILTDTSEAEPIAFEDAPETVHAAASSDAVMTFDGTGVFRLLPETAAVEETALAPAEGERWRDMRVYADRIYALAFPAEGAAQVVRFRPVENGYTTPYAWIRSRSSDLSQATSIAIDGTVFVLSRDGRIVRFGNGSEVGWSPSPVEPPVENAARIWTDADSDFVYVLDAGTNRVIVFAKQDGGLLAQYRSDAFADAQDMLIDEDEELIYILTDDTLHAFTGTHF